MPIQNKANKPRLVISMGDPAGIGPEVIIKALQDKKLAARIQPLVIGDPEVMKRAAKICRSKIRIFPVKEVAEADFKPGILSVWNISHPFFRERGQYKEIIIPRGGIMPGKWSPYTGKVSYIAVEYATKFVLDQKADAIVTAPICKQAWHAAGVFFSGHTEVIGRLTKTKDFAMMFMDGKFRLVLVTIHEPLAQVPKLITRQRIIKITHIAAKELQERFNIKQPRIAVAGLNPHAGEAGIIGQEEIREIIPAIQDLAHNRRFEITGPYSPDALFINDKKRLFDLIVCMYHDQGLIPFKMAAIHRGVNVTAGLPIIRTSPDHGTAFDLAGKGRAQAGSMSAALSLAADMVVNSRKKG
ncbi:4-hydroxythreonine-4-phosphate dehydrogenase PdxA [bacterium]|nr:4-hydroxythreonine-4-phosphate dehydrogenase PdxA [bacterium]